MAGFGTSFLQENNAQISKPIAPKRGEDEEVEVIVIRN